MANRDGLMAWCQMQMLQEELVRLSQQDIIILKYSVFEQMVVRALCIQSADGICLLPNSKYDLY